MRPTILPTLATISGSVPGALHRFSRFSQSIVWTFPPMRRPGHVVDTRERV